MKYTESMFGTPKEILYNDDYAGFAHNVNDEGVTANEEGKKIVKAGTPLNDKGKKATTTDGKSDAIGILLADVDVTYGRRPGTFLYRGCLVESKLPEALTNEEKAALPMIKLF